LPQKEKRARIKLPGSNYTNVFLLFNREAFIAEKAPKGKRFLGSKFRRRR